MTVERNMLKKLYLIVPLFFSPMLYAETVLDYLVDANGKYIGPSVEDQVALMDKDHNGFADVYEVRAYLELQHGKGYEKAILDKWESSAQGKSCSTPFAKELMTDQTYQPKQ
jgi:hypothetical protein